jgi:hypothetical protein
VISCTVGSFITKNSGGGYSDHFYNKKTVVVGFVKRFITKNRGGYSEQFYKKKQGRVQ